MTRQVEGGRQQGPGAHPLIYHLGLQISSRSRYREQTHPADLWDSSLLHGVVAGTKEWTYAGAPISTPPDKQRR